MTGALARLPWPNVIGKRCLDISAPGSGVAAELDRRGAGEVVHVDVAEAGDPGRVGGDGRFEYAVCLGLLPHHRDPVAVLAAVRPLVEVLLLSVEPIDPVLSVVGRGRALLEYAGDGLRASGGAHRQLVRHAGWVVERVPRPFVLGDAPAGRLDRLATRVLTRSSTPGTLHRAILARPE